MYEQVYIRPEDSKLVITDAIPAEERNTLRIHNCNKIVLADKTLDFSFELDDEIIKQFNKIIINGIVFEKKVK